MNCTSELFHECIGLFLQTCHQKLVCPRVSDLAHIAGELETAGWCTGPALTVTSQGGPGGAAPVVRSLAGVNSAQEAQSPEYNSQRPNI